MNTGLNACERMYILVYNGKLQVLRLLSLSDRVGESEQAQLSLPFTPVGWGKIFLCPVCHPHPPGLSDPDFQIRQRTFTENGTNVCPTLKAM